MRERAATPGAITYAQWLAHQIEAGAFIVCGPPVLDWPTLLERAFPVLRPEHALEARLEARLREMEREAEI